MNTWRQKTLIPVVLLFIVLLFMNLDGHSAHIWSPWGGWLSAFKVSRLNKPLYRKPDKPDFFRPTGNRRFAHGWPCSFYAQTSVTKMASVRTEKRGRDRIESKKPKVTFEVQAHGSQKSKADKH